MPYESSYHRLTQLQRDLGSALFAQIQEWDGEPRLVCASRIDSDGSGRGNSFWVAVHDTRWFVVTWYPRYYSCPEGAEIAQLCRDILASANSVQATIDEAIRDRYGLVEVDEEDFAASSAGQAGT
jgi:hypothetical protein